MQCLRTVPRNYSHRQCRITPDSMGVVAAKLTPYRPQVSGRECSRRCCRPHAQRTPPNHKAPAASAIGTATSVILNVSSVISLLRCRDIYGSRRLWGTASSMGSPEVETKWGHPALEDLDQGHLPAMPFPLGGPDDDNHVIEQACAVTGYYLRCAARRKGSMMGSTANSWDRVARGALPGMARASTAPSRPENPPPKLAPT